MTTFGLVQASSTIDALQNFYTIKQFTSQAKEKNCLALCFPEAFLTGYVPELAADLALSADCKLLTQISKLAQSEQIDLLVGFMETAHNQFFLTHGIFSADGNCQFYRKTHLGEREKTIFSAGNLLEVFSLSCGCKAGIELCVETHFPEITQILSLKGARIIFAPHAVPRISGNREAIWRKYIPARSYDNRVYMACCNAWDDTKFGGGCFVTGPEGDIIASHFHEKEALLCFQLDLDKIDNYHSHDCSLKYRYYPSQRRTDLLSQHSQLRHI